MDLSAWKRHRLSAGLLLIFTPCAFVLGQSYSSPRPEAVAIAPLVEPTAEVLTTTVPLARGDTITADHIGRLQLLGVPPAGAITDPRSLEFHIATTELAPGQLLMRSDVSKDPADAGLAVLVPAGKRAIALRVTDEIAVGDFIRPGDTADLIAVFNDKVAPPADGSNRGAGEARIFLQNVQVLTVGNSVSVGQVPGAKAAQNSKGDTTKATKGANIADITLAVSAEQAMQIALMRSVATYYLALRNYHDAEPSTTVRATLADLLGEVPKTPKAVAAPTGPRTRAVEAVIGTKVQKIEIQP